MISNIVGGEKMLILARKMKKEICIKLEHKPVVMLTIYCNYKKKQIRGLMISFAFIFLGCKVEGFRL